ncbi:MAG: aspartate aminotransferase family protein [Candidatus Actinomarinales bacterium]|nr:MAG: aspartate aminotransferase family protein [Candidatus Actinomarinales bacterium]
MTMESKDQELLSSELPFAWKSSMDTFISRAVNAEIWDEEGKRYLDYVGGYAVLNTGHLHPVVVKKVEEQLKDFTHSCFAFAPHKKALKLCEELNRRYPINEPTKSFLLNSGAEAVENAIKISRYYTKRKNLISFVGGFHGRTHMALGLTGKDTPYKEGFGPFPNEIFHSIFPYSYRNISTDESIKSMEQIFDNNVSPEEVAAIIIEPVLGEGGYIPCEKEFLEYLRKKSSDNGIVLIFDEVQTGFGRTGKMFAAEHFDIEPDIVTLAKGIAGGFPLAAVVGRSEIMDSPKESALGTTFGASPISCSAGLGVLEVIDNEDLLEKANNQASVMQTFLGKIQDESNHIGDVRGLGPMIGVEIVQNKENKLPAKDITNKIIEESKKRGLLLVSCGLEGNVIRFMGPLTTPLSQVEEAMQIFSESIKNI